MKDGFISSPGLDVIEDSLCTTKYSEVFGGDYEFNAFHRFMVLGKEVIDGECAILGEVNFQKGPIKENGVNGVFNEDLILMVLTRLRQFQESPYACRENAEAITKLEEALMWLRKRTTDREMRKVEGTSKI